MDRQRIRRLCIFALATALTIPLCMGQITGFLQIDIPQGFSLISNPFASGSNRVQDLMKDVPDGFELVKFSGEMRQVNRYSADSDTWSIPEMTLTPGEGALVFSPEAFTWNRTGKPVTGMLQNFIPEGQSLRSSILPLDGLLSSDLSFPEIEGVSVSSVDLAGGFSTLATFENGSWTPEEPTLMFGKSLLVNTPSNIFWNKTFVLLDDDNPLQISAQPQGASVDEGGAWVLSVSAFGADDLSYQWQKNGNDILGARAETYEIASASIADSGTYSVVIFTSTHSIRSEQALLEIIRSSISPPTSLPFHIRLSPNGTAFELVISGRSGQIVNVESKRDSLSSPWKRRASDLRIGDDGQVIYSERIRSKVLFFRVLEQVDETQN